MKKMAFVVSLVWLLGSGCAVGIVGPEGSEREEKALASMDAKPVVQEGTARAKVVDARLERLRGVKQMELPKVSDWIVRRESRQRLFGKDQKVSFDLQENRIFLEVHYANVITCQVKLFRDGAQVTSQQWNAFLQAVSIRQVHHYMDPKMNKELPVSYLKMVQEKATSHVLIKPGDGETYINFLVIDTRTGESFRKLVQRIFGAKVDVSSIVAQGIQRPQGTCQF